MKRVGKPVFFIVAILILVFTFTSIFGVSTRNGDIVTTYVKGVNDIRWGIDINGGVEATFSPDTNGVKATVNQLDAAKAIIETRMTQNKITDHELYVDYNNDRIIVRFPWKNDEVSFDPEAAIEELSATALLTFREGNEAESSTTDENGNTVKVGPSGVTKDNVILQGADVTDAKMVMDQDQTSGKIQYMVQLTLSPDGQRKFSEATDRLSGSGTKTGIISIWMDDTMISEPTVKEKLSQETCVIEGNFDAESATALANKIQAGALPFKLVTENFNTISPLLGASSLQAMLIAGLIGFGLIILLMVFKYRLPGFVAILALIGQVGLCFAAVSGYFPAFNSFTMTLPGIAGIILSIGMGVDANIITATRIREEVRGGKTLDGAIQKGNANSFWAIFDGNITTMMVSIILMLVFGPTNILSLLFGPSTTGSIYSFGYTLLVGNIGNFIFGVGASRLMLKSVSGFKPFRNKKLYGGASK